MNTSNLAVSIITFNRSKLLDSCLESVRIALGNKSYPVYIVIQNASREDEKVLAKYSDIISGTQHVVDQSVGIEELINNNRIKAWQIALIKNHHNYVICLEDDVEISPDFFEFTEQVLEQNDSLKDFMGINYGSFETKGSVGTYSRVRYGLHGPASLISLKTFEKLRLSSLQKLHGRLAWDSWVEPIIKMGFVATSNHSRYRDNGIIGTHATMDTSATYFEKLNSSFDYGLKQPASAITNLNIQHSIRSDCKIYSQENNFQYFCRFLAIRFLQYWKIILQKLKAVF